MKFLFSITRSNLDFNTKKVILSDFMRIYYLPNTCSIVFAILVILTYKHSATELLFVAHYTSKNPFLTPDIASYFSGRNCEFHSDFWSYMIFKITFKEKYGWIAIKMCKRKNLEVMRSLSIKKALFCPKVPKRKRSTNWRSCGTVHRLNLLSEGFALL